eukprot:CAMPEP_0202443764 /NCGR_PEP_ID=MMETSP1360-20130828/2944_1 /ASSEMBLY_ACC=CAM_ASM_000848 /TAXON_ID=515479 /ORGANISM="Licmophora paradoxa, Strain CCMP2313" /LENGTH=432 /DNA_ID=CAMNT_0049059545 /DNA_START=56 /DNA_END=1354 /DNA_ORIENTATION=-
MTAFQQSYYNFILASFRHAPIHMSGSAFYAAFDSWLWWLEPWNVEWRKKDVPSTLDFRESPTKATTMLAHSVSNSVGKTYTAVSSTVGQTMMTGTIPMATKRKKKQEIVPIFKQMKHYYRSRYSKQWEPYVAANLHFYTVPLALFLRRARELDFSSNSFSKSYSIVQRVFRVYSPNIVALLNEILSNPDDNKYKSLVTEHNKLLGAYSPVEIGQFSLSSLQNDMRNFLEELHLQYQKTLAERDFFDRIEARLERFATFMGISENHTGAEADIKFLEEQGKLLVGLPIDYEILPNEVLEGSKSLSRSYSALDGISAFHSNGFLTDSGNEHLVRGEIKINPLDVVFIGKPSKQRISSYELTWIVYLMEWSSDWLNRLLGMVEESIEDENTDIFATRLREHDVTSKAPWFRINLRFLADYRTLGCLCLLGWYWFG